MSERVLIKDLPIWASDDLIKEYISSQAQIKSSGFVYKSKAKNNIISGSSSFDNGDRYFSTHPNIDSHLHEKVKLGEYTCRIVYKSSVQNCSRCQGHHHKTSDTEKCPEFVAKQPELPSFTRGTFINFDRCEVTMECRTFMTSEHCYQWNAALEALRDDVAEAVIKAKSPWDAKQLAVPI